jgi:predicted phosphate transport protein (TIGR00153 family)
MKGLPYLNGRRRSVIHTYRSGPISRLHFKLESTHLLFVHRRSAGSSYDVQIAFRWTVPLPLGYIAASSNVNQPRGNSEMGLLNFLPKEEQYFALFIQMTVYISDAARELKEMLADKNHDYQVYAQRIKGLEHACDDLTHSISTRLNKSFITPFDREDIYTMSSALDDIVDLIDDAAMAIIIFDVKEIKPYAQDFAGVIVRMADQLREIVSTLQRPKNITQRLVEIHRLENEGDDIYHAAIAQLFREEPDPLTVLKWKEVYEKLEAAVDRCENVANIIESVIIKHT